MLSKSNKISLRQVMILYLTSIYSPYVRTVAGNTVKEAHQAAWLAPAVSCVFTYLIIVILSKFYVKYKNESFMEITYSITGGIVGKIIVLVYFVWVTILLSIYVRFFSERLVTSIYSDTDISFFIISMLVFVSFVLHSGLVPVARMSEVIFIFITTIFLVLAILLIPNVDIDKLTPISYLDIFPIIKAAINITGINIYIFYFMMISDQINNKEHLKKIGLKTVSFVAVLSSLLIILTIGTLGPNVIPKLPSAFLSAVKIISVLGILEKLESVLISTWIATDFIIITMFSLIALKLFKSLFNLSDEKPFINIFILLIYFLSLYICNEVFELQVFSTEFVEYINIVLGLIIPIILFIVAKIRKKV